MSGRCRRRAAARSAWERAGGQAGLGSRRQYTPERYPPDVALLCDAVERLLGHLAARPELRTADTLAGIARLAAKTARLARQTAGVGQ